jgi:hypothetical protein
MWRDASFGAVLSSWFLSLCLYLLSILVFFAFHLGSFACNPMAGFIMGAVRGTPGAPAFATPFTLRIPVLDLFNVF